MNKIIYDRSDTRFSRVKTWEIHHDEQFEVPNPFMHCLYKYRDQIPNIENIKTFIETGTHTAWTSEVASELFDRVLTVEKNIEQNPYGTKENLADIYKGINVDHPNISFHHGSSPDFLQRFVGDLDEQCVILLDAHSPSSSVLIDELTVLKNLDIRNHVILIDDGVDVGTQGWPRDVDQLTGLIKNINNKYKVINTKLFRDLYLIFEEE